MEDIPAVEKDHSLSRVFMTPTVLADLKSAGKVPSSDLIGCT